MLFRIASRFHSGELGNAPPANKLGGDSASELVEADDLAACPRRQIAV
jgi:hypothetical protein